MEATSAIDRLANCTGETFVRWVLALDVVTSPSEVHEVTADKLLGVTKELPSSMPSETLGRAVVASYALAASPPAIGWLNKIREELGGTVLTAPTEQDAFLLPMSQLAIAAYPELLVLASQPPGPWYFGVNCATARHSSLSDDAKLLARKEVDRDEHRPADVEYDDFCVLFRSTGSGGGEPFDLVPACLLGSATARAVLSSGLSFPLSALLDGVRESVQTMRDALAAEPTTVPVAVWLTGVELPEGVQLRTGNLTISAGDGELCRLYDEFQPPGWSDASRSAGCLLVAELPYTMSLEAIDESDVPTSWPPTTTFTALYETVQRVRTALLLASDEPIFGGEPAWAFFLEPIGSSHSQPFPKPPGPSRRLSLTENGVKRWQLVLTALEDSASEQHLRVALSRLRSAGEHGRRRDDAIIDAVISLEAIFGARNDSTLRVAGSVARLLGSNTEERRDLKRQVSALYSLRSKIVHGAEVDSATVAESADEALDISRRTILAVLERPDLVPLASADRSNRLLVLDD